MAGDVSAVRTGQMRPAEGAASQRSRLAPAHIPVLKLNSALTHRPTPALALAPNQVRFSPAAEAGLARAQHNLACHYFAGKGAPGGQDFAKAAAWFARAAEGGHVGSQHNLGAWGEVGASGRDAGTSHHLRIPVHVRRRQAPRYHHLPNGRKAAAAYCYWW